MYLVRPVVLETNVILLSFAGNTLYYIAKGRKQLVCRSQEKKMSALQECHFNPQTGRHRGRNITLKNLEESYYWSTMTKDVEKYVSYWVFRD